jgi:hypothetical protein
MTERATCTAARNEGFRDGVEAVAGSAPPDLFFVRMCSVNHLIAGWGLLVVGLILNVCDLYGPGGDHLSFAGLVCSIVAIFCVWAGMLAKTLLVRAAWFTWNAIAVGISLVFWLFNHRDLWGIFNNVLS